LQIAHGFRIDFRQIGIHCKRMPDVSPSPRILITGASGLVGSEVTRLLDAQDLPWTALSHRDEGWNPEAGHLNPSLLDGCDTVIHLAGEPIAAKRWTDAQKARIRDSRVNGTRALAEAMARSPAQHSTLICASAIGIYGDAGDEVLTEKSPVAEDFLADVVRGWEDAAAPAREAGVRVVHLRLGVVLSPQGGALAKMLPVFRLGLGGPIGTGKAWMSWIHLSDAAKAFVHALQEPRLKGAYNLVAPQPVQNQDFTKCLGRTLHRPAVLPVPPFALRLLMGEMAGALTQSARVDSGLLQQTGWQPEFPQLGPAFNDLLG
jgi:uncharacterized protein (TIGR01777 family)